MDYITLGFYHQVNIRERERMRIWMAPVSQWMDFSFVPRPLKRISMYLWWKMRGCQQEGKLRWIVQIWLLCVGRTDCCADWMLPSYNCPCSPLAEWLCSASRQVDTFLSPRIWTGLSPVGYTGSMWVEGFHVLAWCFLVSLPCRLP